MDPPATLGTEMNGGSASAAAATLFGLSIMLGIPTAVAAQERYALIVTGATGGPEYAAKYGKWRTSLAWILRERFAFPEDHVRLLGEDAGNGVETATRERVRAALADLSARLGKDDMLLVALIGHGAAADGDDGKFNLVGPDLNTEEWAALIKPVIGRVVFVNMASGSFPFMRRMARRGRIIVTATESAAQEFETVFPEYFIQALDEAAADADRNGRTSLWEAFVFASAGVKTWFEQRGQLATERPLLDDDGDGVGREADAAGADSAVARVTYLMPERPIATSGDAEVVALLKRRAALEAELDALRARKPQLVPDEYELALEKLLLDIARLDRQIRSRS
jgi:hypothetical protein